MYLQELRLNAHPGGEAELGVAHEPGAHALKNVQHNRDDEMIVLMLLSATTSALVASKHSPVTSTLAFSYPENCTSMDVACASGELFEVSLGSCL